MKIDEGNLWCSEAFVNVTEGYLFSESDGPYETFTNDTGELYRSCQSEYGRCISKVYRDVPDGPPIAIGWVFQGIQRYEDTGDKYLREVWVTVHEPKVTHEPTTRPVHKPLIIGRAA